MEMVENKSSDGKCFSEAACSLSRYGVFKQNSRNKFGVCKQHEVKILTSSCLQTLNLFGMFRCENAVTAL